MNCRDMPFEGNTSFTNGMFYQFHDGCRKLRHVVVSGETLTVNTTNCGIRGFGDVANLLALFIALLNSQLTSRRLGSAVVAANPSQTHLYTFICVFCDGNCHRTEESTNPPTCMLSDETRAAVDLDVQQKDRNRRTSY